MTTDLDIARWRLHGQQLTTPAARDAAEVVDALLAVQAENPQQSAWAVAARSTDPSRADLAGLIEDGRVLRTHVLRPTWHYVRAEDAAWLLELTGPRVQRTIVQQLSAMGLDSTAVDRASSTVLDALGERADLTRAELAGELAGRGVETTGQLMMLLMAHLELDGLVCSGRPRAGEHTYARFEDRVPTPHRLDRDDALGELALRYFTGHGPATERDLAYWATLTLTDVRRGLDLAGERLGSFEHDGRRFWHAPGDPPAGPGRPAGHLLQILDEMYRGYQESRWVLDVAGVVPRGRERATGMALVDAQLVAAMRRDVAPDGVVFGLEPHRTLGRHEVEALQEAAGRYGDFLGLPARIEVGPPA